MQASTIKQIIVDFIASGETETDLPYAKMETYENIFREIDPEFTGSFDFNGWQHDFWWYLNINNTNYTMIGSWYYGKYQLVVS